MEVGATDVELYRRFVGSDIGRTVLLADVRGTGCRVVQKALSSIAKHVEGKKDQ